MKLRVFNPPRGGWASSPKASENQNNALRRIRKRRQPENDDSGLRRVLRVDPAIEETMRKAGL